MKKNSQKRKKIENKNKELNNLYVEIEKPNKKRKLILIGLKNILLDEEKIETILEIRKEKNKVLSLIKEKVNKLNLDYKNLSESFPNIKEIESNRKIFENESAKYKKQKKIEFTNSLNEIKHYKNLDKITRIKKNLDLIEEKLKTL